MGNKTNVLSPVGITQGPASNTVDPKSTIRPIGAYLLMGLAVLEENLLAIDTVRGYLLRIDPKTRNTVILNPVNTQDFLDGVGLAVWEGMVWFCKGREVFYCDLETFSPQVFAELPYPANGVAVYDSTVFVTCQKSGYIHCFERATGQLLNRFAQPGIGIENLTVIDGALWVCDRTEQTVYCLDPVTGEIQLSALTPFRSPTGIAFDSGSSEQEPACYVVYADEEPYIRDDPNANPSLQIAFRDRTFIHPLYIHWNAQEHYTLSNGYLVELSYVEELQPLDPLQLNQVEWRIALPSNTLRQRVLQVDPIGHPFTLEEQDGQQVAVFKFDQLQPFQGGLVGWRVLMEMYSLKYHLSAENIDEDLSLPADFEDRYLVDNDELAMDTDTVRRAAKEAVGTETNVLRKMLKIRNYVYESLSYGIRPRIDSPDVVLERGIGSCGEYVGVLLALARLNGIACRTIGRYKCPPHPDYRGIPLEPDFNHVWLEFYVPGIGWLPMESNVDDEIDRGPYPTRFFMGLSWYHTELGKGIKFEKLTAETLPEDFSLGNLALNHIQFRILEELNPEGKAET